jgi:hypothetical protein
MATISSSQSQSPANHLSAYDAFLAKLNFSYFGLITMTITIGSIVGGIAAMYILQNDASIWQLAVCMSFAMANNVAAIGQAPMKWLMNIFIAAVVVNAALIVMNL